MCDAILKISSVTKNEYVGIVSAFNVMISSELKCDQCKVKYKGDPAKQKRHQELKNCSKKAAKAYQEYKPSRAMSGGSKITYFKCPANFQDNFFYSLQNMVDLFDRGIMPYPGSLIEQPSKFVEAANLIHNLRREQEQIAQEKAQRHGRK